MSRHIERVSLGVGDGCGVVVHDSPGVVGEVVALQVRSGDLAACPLPHLGGVLAGEGDDVALADGLADLDVEVVTNLGVDVGLEPVLSVQRGQVTQQPPRDQQDRLARRRIRRKV